MASSRKDGVEVPWSTTSIETCNRFVDVGSVETRIGSEGAENEYN